MGKNEIEKDLALPGGGLTELNERLRRYGKAHKRSLGMSDYIKGELERQPFDNRVYRRLADRIGHCGTWLTFKNFYTVGDVRLVKADFCKQHLLCPLCAIRRGTKSLADWMPKVEKVLAEHAGIKLWFVTFTVKNGIDLKERLEHLRKARQKMTARRRRYLSRPDREKFTESAKALGGMSSVEVKRGKTSGLWHPHQHEIWLTYEDIDQQALSQEWEELTGDSFIVDARPCHGDLVKSFSELFKYALKFSDMEFEDNWEAFWTCRGQRLLGSFGILRGLKEVDDLTDADLKYLPYILMTYKFVGGMSSDAQYSAVKVERREADPDSDDKEITPAQLQRIRLINEIAKGNFKRLDRPDPNWWERVDW